MNVATTNFVPEDYAGTKGPPYPEGWFMAAYSDDLSIGQVTRLRYFDRELVLFRTETGVPQVLNAHCRHVGANLAIGGRVIGEHLQCPFHNWEYGTDGVCKKIPYSPQIPNGAAVGYWPTKEVGGLIFMWHSAHGREPYWEPPAFPEYGDPQWTGYIRRRWELNSTIQEVCENVVDSAHIPAVHGSINATVPPVDYDFTADTLDFEFKFYDNDTFAGNRPNKHYGTYYGLGISVSRSTGHGSMYFLTARTPIDENTLEVRYAMLAARSTPEDPKGELGLAAAQLTQDEFDKDVPIWNGKVFLPRPLLCKGDGPIGRFRLWAQKFFE